MAHIERITIGRLFNLGDYEHVRYEISVSPSENENPGLIIQNLDRALAQINPVSPVSEWDLQRAKQKLETWNDDPKLYDDDAMQKEFKRAQSLISKHEIYIQDRQLAFQEFNRLGGTETYTDHKDTWEDNS